MALVQDDAKGGLIMKKLMALAAVAAAAVLAQYGIPPRFDIHTRAEAMERAKVLDAMEGGA